MPISDDTDCIFKGHLMLGCPIFSVRIVFNQTIVKRLRGVRLVFVLGRAKRFEETYIMAL